MQNPTISLPLSSSTLKPPRRFAGTITALAWASDSTHLAAASSQGSVAIWETRTGICVFATQITREPLPALAWSSHGRCLLLGSAGGTLSLLHLASGEAMTSSSFSHPITRIAYAPNHEVERFFVVAGPLLRIFTAGQPHPLTRHYATPLIDAAWCPAGRSLAVLTQHGHVDVWDVAARSARFQVVLRNAPRCLAWGETDQVLTIGTAQGKIQEYSLTGKHWSNEYAVSRFPLTALSRGELGVIAHSARDAVLWTGQALHALAHSVHTIAIDPRGAMLATACAQAITLAPLS